MKKDMKKNIITSILLAQAALLFIGFMMIDAGWWQSAIMLALLMFVLGCIGSMNSR